MRTAPSSQAARAMPKSDRGLLRSFSDSAACGQSEPMRAIGMLASGVTGELDRAVNSIRDQAVVLREQCLEMVDRIKRLREIAEAYKQQKIDSTMAEEASAALVLGETAKSSEIPFQFNDVLIDIQRVSKLARALKEFAYSNGQGDSLVDLNSMLDNAAALARAQLGGSIEIAVHPCASLAPLRCNRERLGLALLFAIAAACECIRDTPSREAQSATQGRVRIESLISGGFAETRISAFLPPGARRSIERSSAQECLSALREIARSSLKGDARFVATDHCARFWLRVPYAAASRSLHWRKIFRLGERSGKRRRRSALQRRIVHESF